jgi:nucleotide-binding universal stress UspA family protein
MVRLFRKILLAVDGSHSCFRASEITASFAREFGSEVTVVHVISYDFMHPEFKAHYQLSPVILHELDKTYQKAGSKIIRAAEEFFREENVEVNSELIRGEDPAEKILQMVKKSSCDLLTIGNNSEPRARRFSLGNIAEKISLYAKCPVLIAKRKTQIKKVLVAVDGSKKANKALEYAIQLCRHFKAKMTLLHVEEGELFRLEPKETKRVGEQILAESAGKAKAENVACDVRLEFGNPARTILKVAKEEDYDLIVLGSRGVSGVKRFLLGSTSADVSMHAQRSVLIVR